MRKKFWLILMILWCVVIYFFTALPQFTGQQTADTIEKAVDYSTEKEIVRFEKQPDIWELNFIIRKSAHVFVFAVLAFLSFMTVSSMPFPYVLAWLITTVYAALDEWHQSFVPGRTSAIHDVMIDSVGGVLALLLIFVWRRLRRS